MRLFFSLALIGFPMRTCLPQQPPPRPIKVYLLGVDSDLKGEFSEAGRELTDALQTAFSSESGAFTLIDRTNLDELVKANRLEEDLDAVIHGGAPSPRLAHLALADGFIRSQLRDGADGAVLTVALVKLDSVIPWSKQVSYSRAKWLSIGVQQSAATFLAEDAAHKLFPSDAAPNAHASGGDAEAQKAEPIADRQLALGGAREAEPNIEPTFVHGTALSPDIAIAMARSAQKAAAEIASCSAGSPASVCVSVNGTDVSSVRDELENNGIEFATLNDAIHEIETHPTAVGVEHCADALRAVAKKLLDMARQSPSTSSMRISNPPPEVEQPSEPGHFATEYYRMSAGVGQRWMERGTQLGTGTSADPISSISYEWHSTISLPVTVESLSKGHFHFTIQPNSCYLSDEKGNTWTQDATNSSGSYYPDSVGISSHGVEVQPGVPVKSSFFLTAQGETTGTLFTLVCSEGSPTQGRQIVIRGITSH